MTEAKLLRLLLRSEKAGKSRVQDFGETHSLCKLLIKMKKIDRILEIGTGGGSTPIWELLLEGTGKVVTIDINSKFYDPIKHNLDLSLVTFIQANSLDAQTIKKVKAYFDYETVDFLFIDGEHAYDFVKSDYVIFRAFVRRGGMIVLHDTIFEGPRRVIEEARNDGFRTQIIGSACGYGIIFKDAFNANS